MIRVMIVEDQEMIRKSLSIVLSLATDLEVVGTAEHGQEAVEKLETMTADVILMDIHMPVMDGVEATGIIKKRWPESKVIILTTFQDIQHVTGALQAGAEGYILKAIDPMDLSGAIQLVYRGETLISQDVAKALFAKPFIISDSKESVYGLTEREMQVLKCISDGLANRDIAAKLFLSEGTVKNYISSIYSKLNVHNRASATKKASEEGLF